jgi:hypothetical protein
MRLSASMISTVLFGVLLGGMLTGVAQADRTTEHRVGSFVVHATDDVASQQSPDDDRWCC